MSSGDIKAGGAYVELGLKGFEDVKSGLKTIGNQVRDFGEGLRTIGASMAALGGTIAAPLVASTKIFADFGKEVGRLSAQTGVSAQLLSALGYAGEQSGVGIESIGHAIEKMERGIVSGSAHSQEAFARLGLSMSQLRSMSPEDQFGAIADAMSKLDDDAEAVAFSMQIFGRSGAELLPMLRQGAAGIARYSAEAKTLGVSLGTTQTKNARELAESFHRLESGIKGVALQIGAALMPVLKPVIDFMVDATIAAQGWIQTNPEFITGLAKIATTLVTVGGALAIVGTMITALMSPAAMAAAAIVGIGTAALAVTDSLGVTATGFGQLFNSIRIDGTGLGTWFTGFFIVITRGFNGLAFVFTACATGLWHAFSFEVLKVENLFSWLISGIIAGWKLMLNAFNAIAPKSLQVDTSSLDSASSSLQHFRDFNNKEIDDNAKSTRSMARWFARNEDDLDKAQTDVFRRDPQDASGGIHVDTSRMKEALKTIGGNIWDKLAGGADSLFGKFNIPHHEFASAPEHMRGAGIAATSQLKGSVLGSFNASAIAGLGAGPNVAERVAKASEETARNTQKLVRWNDPAQRIAY